MTLIEKLNRFPPKLCRLVARKANGRRPMSHRDVARSSGLSRSYVIKISTMDVWDRLPVGTIEAFASACGVNLMNVSRHRGFLRHKKKSYMANATPAQRRMLGRLMADLTRQPI